jgi:Bacterial protein of unknown function (DUF899)
LEKLHELRGELGRLFLENPVAARQRDAGPHAMGWTVPFVSSHGSTFAADCGAGGGFMLSAFLRDATEVYRTYNTTQRGVDRIMWVHNLLDLTGLRPPGGLGGLARGLAAAVLSGPIVPPVASALVALGFAATGAIQLLGFLWSAAVPVLPPLIDGLAAAPQGAGRTAARLGFGPGRQGGYCFINGSPDASVGGFGAS